MEQQLIKARYVRLLLAAHRVATNPIVHEKAAIDTIVPTPNAARYPSAWPVVRKARIGSTPRKCELPASP